MIELLDGHDPDWRIRADDILQYGSFPVDPSCHVCVKRSTMTSAELDILEKAFVCEVNAALNHRLPGLMQTRSKLAGKLVTEGYLANETIRLGGALPVNLTGFVLTHRGRLAYCESDRVKEGDTVE